MKSNDFDNDRRFLPFEQKTIDEQAHEVTHSLLFEEEESRFDFDAEDRSEKKKFQKECHMGAYIVLSMTVIDIKVLNAMKWGR